MKSKSLTIQMKATEQYFPVMLFIQYSNKSPYAILSIGAGYYVVQRGSKLGLFG